MKRIISLVLSVAMLLSITAGLNLNAYAENLTYNEFEYDKLYMGGIVIKKYKGTTSIVEIPELIDGYPVVQIGDYAFRDCTFITKINIPNSIEVIGKDSFSNCVSLLSINIPEKTRYIREFAFFGCSSLRKIDISKNIQIIGIGAFSNCTSLEKIVVDSKNIYYSSDENGVLYDVNKDRLCQYPCGKKETNYTIIPSVIEIQDYAFAGSIFESIEFSKSVTYIGDYAFLNCNLIKEIVFPDNLVSIGNGVFNSCRSLENVLMNDALTSIGIQSFYGCISLVSIYIPENVKMIGNGIFENCNSLININVDEGNDYYCDMNGVLFNKEINLLIQYPIGKKSKSYIVPKSVEKINYGAFIGCAFLNDVSISKNVDTIGASAFNNCPNLKSIAVLNNDINIEFSAFPSNDEFILYSYNSSSTEVYAQKYNIPFVAISDAIADMEYSGASVTLQDDLSLNFKASKSAVDGVLAEENVSAVYATFNVNGVETKVDAPAVSGESYSFTCPDIAPNMMNDTVNAKLYVTIDGADICVDTASYSVADYCYAMLDETDDAELKTLLVDMLNYGADSQVYTSYKTDNLANTNLTDEQKSFGTPEEPALNSILDTEYAVADAPSAEWLSAGLRLDENISMRFKFSAQDITNLSVKVTSESGEWTISSAEFVPTNGGYYVYFNGFNAGQLSEAVYVTVYDGDTAVSSTLRYSIETYAAMAQGTDNEALKRLTNSMMKYGNSAYAYIH